MSHYFYNTIVLKGRGENILQFLNAGLENSNLPKQNKMEDAYNVLISSATSDYLEYEYNENGRQCTHKTTQRLSLGTFSNQLSDGVMEIEDFELKKTTKISTITFYCDTLRSIPYTWLMWVRETFCLDVFVCTVEECAFYSIYGEVGTQLIENHKNITYSRFPGYFTKYIKNYYREYRD